MKLIDPYTAGELRAYPLEHSYARVYPRDQSVYFLWRCERLVYIGRTGSLANRLKQHRMTKDFGYFSFVAHPDKLWVTAQERELIRLHRPEYNVRGVGLCLRGINPLKRSDHSGLRD